ncbi:MAG: DUF1611 domain-containing protein [Planctomycetota bacterium]
MKRLDEFARIVLLTEGASNHFVGKTAICMLRYRTDDICAVLDSEEQGKTANDLFHVGGAVPVVGSLDEVENADALVIGIAPPGGKLPANWRHIILTAISRKMTVVSGLHDFLANDDEFRIAAKSAGANLIDIRRNDENRTATGEPFSQDCFRVHTVGQDCSVGKMVVSVELQRALIKRGINAGFAATGQTGIMISGNGIPIDCVVADFVNGAAERLVRSMEHHEMVVIEGQGCITHPAYSAVTLGLLHGCAPQAMVLCYEAKRTHVKGFSDTPLQPLENLISLYEQMATVRVPSKVVAIGLNSRLLSEEEFRAEKDRVSNELGLPVCDVIREGADSLADAVLEYRRNITQ